jgi:cytochrome c oxidase assembly factor CtaG
MERTSGQWAALLGLVSVLLVAILLPPLDRLLGTHLGLHHLQHGLTLVLGIGAGGASYRLVAMMAVRGSGQAQALARDLLIVSRRANPGGYVSLGVAAGLLIFWHIPFFFNLAVLDDAVHILEHLSFIIAGGGVGFGLALMSKWTRLGAVLIAVFSGLLLSVILVVFELHVYEVYPREHEVIFGVAMIYAMMPLMIYAVYRFLVEQVS